MSEIRSYHETLPAIAEELAERGSRAVLVMDASPLGMIEDAYGSDAYNEVRNRALRLVEEQQGKDFRSDDLVCLDQPGGLRFLFFLAPKRRRALPTGTADLKAMKARLATSLAGALGRSAFPYLRAAPRVELGYSVAIHNPLVRPERLVLRAIEDALRLAAHEREAEHLTVQERLLDIILRERVITAFQPILRLADHTVLGFEGLSRGPKGSGLESADTLFGAASEHNLVVELDRLCRRRVLLSSGRVSSNALVFVNTLPATIRDPQFRGKPLIDFLSKAQVAPNRIVIEITEKLVIENYTLFREAMTYYTDLGMSFAVDDVGAGYSGLESIARLKPTFLKIDIALVRDVHASLVNREMVKAIVAMGRGIGATVIAEGIQAEEEATALQAMDVAWGQGFLLGRPDAGPE